MRAKKGEGLAWIKSVLASPPTDECMVWPYGVAGKGYAYVYFEGKYWRAHRLCLYLHKGAEPAGMVCAHGPCNNKLCCNPSYLSFVTQAVNVSHRKRDGTEQVGEEHKLAKLSEAQAVEIISLRGLVKINDIAARYGVSKGQVSSIQTGRTWKHLPRPQVTLYERATTA